MTCDSAADALTEAVCADLRSLDVFSTITAAEIQVEALQTLAHSRVYRVRVASPACSLILKKPGPDDGADLARRERLFYRCVAPMLPDSLVPECVGVVEKDHHASLFLKDLSATHDPVSVPEPSEQQCQSFVTALATLHALTGIHSPAQRCWTEAAAGLPAATIEQRLSFCLLALDDFLTLIRSRTDPSTWRLLAGLKHLTEQIGRLDAADNVLVHGDAHFANALYDPSGQACLIDWGMPMIGFPELDLAHAVALNLPPHLRRAREAGLLRSYLDQLAACGRPLQKQDCLDRFRLGIRYSLLSPVIWWASGVHESLWWPCLFNAVSAAGDHGLRY